MELVLKLEKLSKSYNGKTVVKDVDLEINKGDIYGLIGENAAGKTTILNMILGLVSPTEGKISLFGSSDLGKERHKVGNLLDTPAIYPDLTAAQNIIYYCTALGIKDKESSLELLDLVNLPKDEKKKTRDFSLGMKQRLALAISLLNSPEFIIMDEPFNGLDPEGIKKIRDTILRLNQEKEVTFLISSHILEEISKISTRYGMIRSGRLVQEFSSDFLNERTEEVILRVDDNTKASDILKETYKKEDIKIRIEDNNLIVEGKSIESSEINSILVKNGISVYLLQDRCHRLEDIFLNTIQTKPEEEKPDVENTDTDETNNNDEQNEEQSEKQEVVE